MGDQLSAVGGRAVAGQSIAQLTTAVNGAQSPTYATITLQREGLQEAQTVTVLRTPVAAAAPRSVRLACVLPQNLSSKDTARSLVGYIKLVDFGPTAADEVPTALLQLSGADQMRMSGLVLDLRDNPGCLLDQAVEIASMVLQQGAPIVTVKDGQGRTVIESEV